jgi:hypothetical protein
VQTNVLSHLASNENSVTTLLKALCSLKPIREVVIRLFTHKNFGAADVAFDDISTQVNIGNAILDMGIQADELHVGVEIKVLNSTGLTGNQPQAYLRWLAQQCVRHKFFVFLVPPLYDHQEYEKRKQAFCAAHPGHGIQFVEITWLDVCTALDETGLSATSVYARDFRNLLEEWYVPTPITFTLNELREIYCV